MTTIQIDNFLDWQVFATRPNWATQPKVKLDHEYNLFSDIGRAIARSSNDIAREVVSVEYLLENKEEIAGMRDFFDTQYGMVGAFWLPSWRSDIIVNTAFDATDVDLFIVDMPYQEYFLFNFGAGRYLMFEFPDLTRYYNKVVGAPATDHLILAGQIGKAATTAELQYLRVSFLYLVRFDVDELRFDYFNDSIAKTQVSFRTIFDEAVTSTTSTTTTTTVAPVVTTTTSVTVVTTTTVSTTTSTTVVTTTSSTVTTTTVSTTTSSTIDARIAVTAANSPTVPGTQDFTKAGFGTPTGYLIFSGFGILPSVNVDNINISVGGGDGTTEWCTSQVSEDAQASTDASRRGTTTQSIIHKTLAGAIDGEANFVSFITDGIRIDWTDAPSDEFRVIVVLIGGSASQCYADTDSSVVAEDVADTFNNAGFEPDVVFLVNSHTTWNDANVNDAILSFGIATNEDTIKQGCSIYGSNQGESSAVVQSGVWDNRIHIEFDPNPEVIDSAGEITAFNPTGFDMTKRDGGAPYDFAYLAVSFGGLDVSLNHYDTPILPDNLVVVTGHVPQWVLVAPTACTAMNVMATTGPTGAGVFALSGFDQNREGCLGLSDEDAVPTTNCTSLVADIAIHVNDNSGSDMFLATGPKYEGSFDPDGYTLNFTVTDGTPRKWFSLSIEEP